MSYKTAILSLLLLLVAPAPVAGFVNLGPSDVTAGGDPHFKTWNGTWWDYHGQCDLVFLDNPEFYQGLGMTIHIRTKHRGNQYSYIESVALQIGSQDVLEVSSFGQYSLNGVEDAHLPFMIADQFLLSHVQEEANKNIFTIELTENKEDEHIKIIVFKDMVTINLVNATNVNFGDSLGLMGNFQTGALLDRNGKDISNSNGDTWKVFAEEWQVRDTEPKLFVNQDSHPQYPNACVMPGANTQESRRLGEKPLVSQMDAEKACAQWSGETKKMCIFDVVATGDLEVASNFGDF